MNVWLLIEQFADYEDDVSVFSSHEKALARVQEVLDHYASEGIEMTQWEGQEIWSGRGNKYHIELKSRDVQ